MCQGPSWSGLERLERELEAQRAKQEEALAQIDATLTALGDVEIAIPNDFLEELSTLTEPQTTRPSAMPMLGIRG